MNENSTKDKEAKISANEKEWNLEISEQQYEEAKAKGFDDETLFEPGKHTFRRRDPDENIKAGKQNGSFASRRRNIQFLSTAR